MALAFRTAILCCCDESPSPSRFLRHSFSTLTSTTLSLQTMHVPVSSSSHRLLLYLHGSRCCQNKPWVQRQNSEQPIACLLPAPELLVVLNVLLDDTNHGIIVKRVLILGFVFELRYASILQLQVPAHFFLHQSSTALQSHLHTNNHLSVGHVGKSEGPEQACCVCFLHKVQCDGRKDLVPNGEQQPNLTLSDGPMCHDGGAEVS
mmetsp:Transcript_20749/g.32483  ORF Transcript_20749/g.32483 Transcript_20749/m.32483 type:complete len:205 (-) Transcript_20749:1490-2104(-)